MSPPPNSMPPNSPAYQIYAEWLRNHCRDNDDEIVRSSSQVICGYLNLCDEIPSEHRWRFSGAEALQRQYAIASDDPARMTRVYWGDLISDVESYSTVTMWRGAELMKSSISLLNTLDIVASAVLVRAHLELACGYLWHANELDKYFNEVSFPRGKFVFSTALSKKVIKMLWGSRHGKVGESIKQTNVMTYIQKLAKNKHAGPLEENYGFLCDVAHPNFIGNARYWSFVEKTNDDGSEELVLNQKSADTAAMEIANKVVWAAAWSAMVMQNAFIMIARGIDLLKQKLPG